QEAEVKRQILTTEHTEDTEKRQKIMISFCLFPCRPCVPWLKSSSFLSHRHVLPLPPRAGDRLARVRPTQRRRFQPRRAADSLRQVFPVPRPGRQGAAGRFAP